MRIPVSRAHESLRFIVDKRSSTFTVTRGTNAIGSMGEVNETENTHTADAWVYAPRNSPLGTDYGDRLQGELRALARPSEDFQHADEIDHGGETYQVQEPIQIPNEDDNQLQVFALQRKTND